MRIEVFKDSGIIKWLFLFYQTVMNAPKMTRSVILTRCVPTQRAPMYAFVPKVSPAMEQIVQVNEPST